MPNADLLLRPATELADLVRSGEVTARELVDLSLDRIAALDERVGAFVTVDADGARAAADQVGAGDERAFAGVPVAIKDNRAVAGLPLTLASDFMGDFTPSHDGNVTERLRRAGFVIVGTTQLPEWGIMPVTDPSRGGPARNPWDLERTAGGSSGGAAAAVAAGMLPVAHGNDGGGSIRIPAACCGLVGLKPSRGRVSLAPEAGEAFLVQDGMLTRTVADTAALLDVLAGPVVGDASWAPPPAEPFAVSAAREPGRLRIALTVLPPVPEAVVDPEYAEAARATGRLLEQLGHEVVEADPPWQAPGGFDTFVASFGPAICSQIAVASLITGKVPSEADMEPLSWWLWETCRGIDSVGAALAAFQLQALARMVVGWSEPYDAVLTPALATAPPRLGELDPRASDGRDTFERGSLFTPFAALQNITGQPAISLPTGISEAGLPLAVQLVGRPAQEGALLALAAQVEAARPWADQRPALLDG